MTTFTNVPKQVEDGLDHSALTPSRRNFLKSAGLLVVSFSAAATDPLIPGASAQTSAGPYHDPDFHKLDSWIVIHEDNTATFYVGKTDCGQGTGTSFRQLMSDELDIAFDNTTCIMGSTDITVDQGGSGGSTAMERDAWPMRRAAAEARRVLLEMGSSRLGVPVDQLAVHEGVITVKADPAKTGQVGAPIPGAVTSVAVALNQVVAKGERLLVMEAMKMQSTIYAPVAGKVTQLLAQVGENVEAKDLLLVIE